MHPLEIIVSVDRVQTAKDLQPNALHSQAATSDLNVKKLHESEKLERETVAQSDKYESINPDDKGNQPEHQKKSSSEAKKESPSSEEESPPPPQDQKGHHVDIIV